ncbi:MAG: hypothetical protein ACAH59_01505 [Pseudobdellovibrionaceae bacterium]
MKEFLQNLQKGQPISVNVIEVQIDRQILVSYRGELFRVKNTSGRRFNIGEKVILVVTQKNPLEFSLAGEQRLFSRIV